MLGRTPIHRTIIQALLWSLAVIPIHQFLVYFEVRVETSMVEAYLQQIGYAFDCSTIVMPLYQHDRACVFKSSYFPCYNPLLFYSMVVSETQTDLFIYF